MGTHPIFESDFDCLTGSFRMADMDDMFGDDIVPAENETQETPLEPMETGEQEEGSMEQNGTAENDTEIKTETNDENGVAAETIVIEDEKIQDGGVIDDAEEEKKEEKKPEIVPY